MDRKLYIATLSKQSEYLGQLVTELNTALLTLEQALGEGNSPPALDATVLFQGFEGLERRLASETEMLCKRLHVFLEGSQASNGSPVKT